MTTFDAILKELRQTPEPILRKVLEFVHRLKDRPDPELLDTAAASEQALADDWNRPEEDEAWRTL